MNLKAIVDILYTIENGFPDPSYGAITLLHDGDGGRLQVTLGVGYTEGGGDLKAVVQRYITTPGARLAQALALFVGRINDYDGPNKTILAGNSDFITFLKQAGEDPVMQAAQDHQFNLEVMGPADTWAAANGFTLSLSLLVIADSFLQSGEIFQFLRNRFPEKTPANGGDEKAWINAYVMARDNWLENAGGAMRSSSYRTKFFHSLILEDDWDLAGPRYVINGSPVVVV